MTAMYFEEKERERERGKYSHKFCPRVAVPSCFRQSYAPSCFKEDRVALKLLRLEWVRADVTLSASRWQMHQVLQKLTFAVTKFDDALSGGSVALLAPPQLVQGVLVFCGTRASVVADMVCNEEQE